MSDVTISYLGALIFFANLKENHGYCLQGGYLLVKYKFINQELLFCFYFCISTIWNGGILFFSINHNTPMQGIISIIDNSNLSCL